MQNEDLGYLQRCWQNVVTAPGIKWAGAFCLACAQNYLGPLDRPILQILGFLFVNDLLMGITRAFLMSGRLRQLESEHRDLLAQPGVDAKSHEESQAKVEAVRPLAFNYRRVAQSLLKFAVYVILLNTATMFRRSADVGPLPILGTLIGTALEGFLVLTEGSSVIQNADDVTAAIGTKLPFLSELRAWLDNEADKRLKVITGGRGDAATK